jgi:hypothetical protein
MFRKKGHGPRQLEDPGGTVKATLGAGKTAKGFSRP